MKQVFVVLLIAAVALTSCTKEHFINDDSYRNQVHNDYLARRELAQKRDKQLFNVLDSGTITLKEREALEFLYAYMPFSDLADRDGDFYLNQVRYSFMAKDYFTWGKTIPEDVFRHFVLVYRVNNENLDSSRMVFFNELKDRIKDMSMYDAALEVNHWCHEKVAYRPSDSRTSSPLATIRTSYGRCGEESTFTVTAMRSVGIPARQCYTPRWAHTDDNHAWVEVWVDGQWYFLGACEPDARLNMGWFAFPATRTMMVHSNAFGKYNGKEEINYSTNLFSRINMLSNYTDTNIITIKVVDSLNNPVANAAVKFKLYNYAEYYPIASSLTDVDGKASVTTGYGDLLIWASKDDIYGYAEINAGKQDELTIQLNRHSGEEYVELFEMTPPTGKPQSTTISKEETDKNNARLQYEDSIRTAYMSTFPTQDDISDMTNPNLTPQQIWSFIEKSVGNYVEIQKFINNNAEVIDGLLLNDYLESMSEKDLRDASADVMQQQLTLYASDSPYPVDVFIKGVLPARVSNEFLYPWRQYLHDNLPIVLNNNISSESIRTWINENITIDKDGNYFNCPISPRGVFELRYSDPHSRDIFFVAACRSLNIPSYLDNATNQLFVYENGTWNIVSFEEEKVIGATGNLVLTINSKSDVQPIYWTHFTIAKFVDGDFVTFDYENDPRVANFPAELELEAGYYMLSTGNRYSDGTTQSRLEFFNIIKDQTVTKAIILQPLTPRDESYGKIDLQIIPDSLNDNKNVADYIADKQLVLCFIDPMREPTKHLFKDITTFKSQFEQWGGSILFVTPSEKKAEDFDPSKWNLPCNSIFISDLQSKWLNSIVSSTGQTFIDNFPLVFIVNNDGELVFKSEGYRIGTGELIYNSLQK